MLVFQLDQWCSLQHALCDLSQTCGCNILQALILLPGWWIPRLTLSWHVLHSNVS